MSPQKSHYLINCWEGQFLWFKQCILFIYSEFYAIPSCSGLNVSHSPTELSLFLPVNYAFEGIKRYVIIGGHVSLGMVFEISEVQSRQSGFLSLLPPMDSDVDLSTYYSTYLSTYSACMLS